MSEIKRVAEWTVEFGGEEHSGWLPKGAAVPERRPLRRVELALAIIQEGPGSYILEWRGPDEETSGDRSYSSLEAAISEADELFSIPTDAWLEPGGSKDSGHG